MLEFTTPEAAPPVEREVLFSFDGVEATIPVEFTTADGLLYTHVLRNEGVNAAIVWALHAALGDEGYGLLLANANAIGDEGLEKVTTIITQRILGRRAVVPGPKPITSETGSPETGSPSSPKPRRKSAPRKTQS